MTATNTIKELHNLIGNEKPFVILSGKNKNVKIVSLEMIKMSKGDRFIGITDSGVIDFGPGGRKIEYKITHFPYNIGERVTLSGDEAVRVLESRENIKFVLHDQFNLQKHIISYERKIHATTDYIEALASNNQTYRIHNDEEAVYNITFYSIGDRVHVPSAS